MHGEGGSYGGGNKTYGFGRGPMAREDPIVAVEEPMALKEGARQGSFLWWWQRSLWSYKKAHDEGGSMWQWR